MASMLLVAHAVSLGAQGHAHGVAELDIGIEGTTGTFELRIPGDDLYGFEHAPRTPRERAARDAAYAMLRAKAASLVRFDPIFGCTVAAPAITSTGGAHGETRARYTFACRTPPVGRDIAFGVTAAFPRVSRVKVQVLTETSQTGKTIVGDRGTVRP
jgi:hypothetical protein